MKLKFTNKMKGANKFNNKAGIVSSISSSNNVNRQCLSADGFSLLPSALRPCLFLWLVMMCGIVSGFFINATSASATSSVSISLTQATASLNISPKDSRGTFNKTTSGIAFSVNTNNYSGYTLSIRASSNGTNAANLTQDITSNSGTGNGTTTTYAIQSIGTVTGVSSAGIDEATFSGANNTQYNNKWGYQPNKLNSQNNSNYLPAPTGNSDNNAVTLDSTNASGNSNYTINIGARVDNTIPMGQYSNTFVVTAVANLINYTIAYNKGNTQDTVTNLPANQTGVVEHPGTNTDITLTSDTPIRAGKSFIGWCSELPTAGDPDTCSGTTYTAGGTYSLNPTISPNVTLYAMWGPPTLYDSVAAMSKGKNTSANGFSWTSITTPTSTDPSTDTSTSGVYEWGGKDGTGTGADSNGGSNPIYFYRGVLDTTVASYGSDGPADAYPNYVILSSANNKNSLATTDTCWRIVRTTSTGGVKMIYNGTWTGGDGGTCANATTAAQTTTSPFNNNSATVNSKTYTGLQYQNIHAVGYTYSNVAAGTTSTRTPSKLFGASGNDTTTNANSSIIKQYIEDWYAGTLTSYTSILEGDAGYCQDRRLNTSTAWTTPLAEDSNTITPYGRSGMTLYYFGAYPRNYQSSTFDPLLTCPRGKVDLYSYSSNVGNGNGQLTYPVALLTADEASIAGSGAGNSYNAYNANSYLRSGSLFWLLSPGYRGSYGYAFGFSLTSNGYLNGNGVSNASGVRPAISLKPGTTAASGAGTATDPWIVNPPQQ